MRHIVPLLIVAVIVGCQPAAHVQEAANVQEAAHVEVQPGDILHLKIEDYNWEARQTVVYEVSAETVTVYDKQFASEILETVPIIKKSDIWPAMNRISKIYTESMVDEEVADGTSLTFVFTLRDGETAQTHVSNLIIDEYAAVTQAISDVVDRDIHYHQYDSKRH